MCISIETRRFTPNALQTISSAPKNCRSSGEHPLVIPMIGNQTSQIKHRAGQMLLRHPQRHLAGSLLAHSCTGAHCILLHDAGLCSAFPYCEAVECRPMKLTINSRCHMQYA
eukprot:1967250-Amphidinium_carterae.1